MYRIGFRTDGGANVGMGHVMRCLSLAGELRKEGFEVVFLSRHREGIEKIRCSGFETYALDDVFESRDPCRLLPDESCSAVETAGDADSGLMREAEEIVEFTGIHKTDLLIVDTYNVNERYFRDIRRYVGKIGYIDDLNRFAYPVDLLINGNITGEYMNYGKYSDREIFLLGPGYIPVRDEFRNLPPRIINDRVCEIMITTGGTDPFDMSLKILDILRTDKDFRHLKINLIVGGGFAGKQKLAEAGMKSPGVVIHESITHISAVMAGSDAAISAGGSTLYELCACGTPTLAFVMADNQKGNVNKMDELGYVRSLGWYYELEKKLAGELKYLMENPDIRRKMSAMGRKLVDGKGAERVAAAIKGLLEQYE